MSLVLILTNNVENELDSYNKFRQLGYEILVSSKALLHWRMNNNFPVWVTTFPVVIISETIPDKEAIEIYLYLKEFSIVVLRKAENEKELKKVNSYFNLTQKNCFSNGISVTELTEMMFNAEYNTPITLAKKNITNIKLSPYFESLSGREKQLLNILIKNSKQIISRENLALKLWSRTNRSELSQLSVLVRKINHKAKRIYNFDSVILTAWGQGYYLNDKFLESYTKIVSSNSINEEIK